MNFSALLNTVKPVLFKDNIITTFNHITTVFVITTSDVDINGTKDQNLTGNSSFSSADGGRKFLFVTLFVVCLAIFFTLVSLLVNMCSPPFEEIDPELLAQARAKSKLKLAGAAAPSIKKLKTKTKSRKSKIVLKSVFGGSGKVAVKEVNTVGTSVTTATPMLKAKETATSNLKMGPNSTSTAAVVDKDQKGATKALPTTTATSSSALKENVRKGGAPDAKDKKKKKDKKKASSQHHKKKK